MHLEQLQQGTHPTLDDGQPTIPAQDMICWYWILISALFMLFCISRETSLNTIECVPCTTQWTAIDQLHTSDEQYLFSHLHPVETFRSSHVEQFVLQSLFNKAQKHHDHTCYVKHIDGVAILILKEFGFLPWWQGIHLSWTMIRPVFSWYAKQACSKQLRIKQLGWAPHHKCKRVLTMKSSINGLEIGKGDALP